MLCVTNVSDQIFQLFVADEATAGLVQCSECHLDGVEIVDNQHLPTHHQTKLIKLDGSVVVRIKLKEEKEVVVRSC